MTEIWNAARAALIGAMLTWALAPAQAQYGPDYCQLLDRLDDPIWHAYIGYVARAQIRGFRNMDMIEAGAGAGLLYFRTDYGELDLKFALDSVYFMDHGGVRLPDHVSAARLDLNYVVRLEDGYAVRLGVEPGFYSEIEHVGSDHFFYPFSIHGIRALTPNASALAGLNFYPGFDRRVDPRFGIRWAISDYMLIDVFYPKSEMVFRPGIYWAFRAGVEFREYLEYQLKGSDDRKRLMMDETRIYFGVDHLITDDVQLLFQIGRVVDRSIDFRQFELKKRVEDAYFLRIGLGGLI